MQDSIILIGGGGHCKSCIDVIEQQGKFSIAGMIDRPDKIGNKVCGYTVFWQDTDIPALTDEYHFFFITLGQIKTAKKRIQLFLLLKKLSLRLPVIISPCSYVAQRVEIGQGTIVHHHALINTGSSIGTNCIINSGALVEHDSIIEDHCHISTGSILNGEVRIGRGTFIGSGAVIRNGIEIGRNCVIGAGIKVMNSIAPGTILKESY